MLAAFPLLSLVLLAANLIALSSATGFGYALFSITLPSTGSLAISAGDALVISGLVLLYFEIFKATRTGSATILDHALSLLVFIIALVEFLILPRFAHAAFLALVLMTMIDVIAGFTVTIAGARRDFGPMRQE
jgi:FtsH-binding integral membrane protein